MVRKLSGSVRIDLVHESATDHLNVAFDRGEVTVHRGAKARRGADCRVVVDRDLFDNLVTGNANATAAVLRGAMVVDGNVEKLVAFQRLFPGPPHRRPSGRRQWP